MPPQPPPVSISMVIFMLVLSLTMSITFFMQGSLIAFSARVIKSYQGIREASLSTFALALAYLIFMAPPSPMVGRISNILTISGYCLLYLALARFTETPLNRVLVFRFFPIAVVTLITAGFVGLPPIYVNLIVSIIFLTNAVLILHRNDSRRYALAARLTIIPLFILIFFMTARLIISIIFPEQAMPTPSISSNAYILILYVLSYLWTAGFVLMVSQRLQSDLNDLAMNDALTRVHNRRAMQDMLEFEMQRVEEEVRNFSIILLDIDHFKRFNDTYGHDIGDVVLQWMAAKAQNSMRVQDVVARWGGEEFLILLPDTELDEAMSIAERLRSLIGSSQIETSAGNLHVTFSAGVSCSTSTRNVDELYKIADQALYIAKETRNRVASQDEIPANELPSI